MKSGQRRTRCGGGAGGARGVGAAADRRGAAAVEGAAVAVDDGGGDSAVVMDGGMTTATAMVDRYRTADDVGRCSDWFCGNSYSRVLNGLDNGSWCGLGACRGCK